ncbi:hypothetical protein C2G38_2043773 [Gigaspora rosea]|uniref:Uncharacterized protein n=1 Tax=Gigaspora rosea TaxID=44941 RepID=A0A397UII0_9GLOM|nr:hypothetical protein C2G38_2043773 [Gigaspora rosea]
MAWEERLDNAEKVRQAVTINRITSPTNKSNTESSLANNSNVESSSTNKSNVESRPVDKLNSELDGPNTPGHSKIMCDNSEAPNYDDYDIDDNYNSDDGYSNDENKEITNEESIIGEWVKVDYDKINENENENDENENEKTEELNTVSFDTTDLYNNHPAVHEDSKIELQYLFTRDLSQLSFVCVLQQCIEDNSVVSNTRK